MNRMFWRFVLVNAALLAAGLVFGAASVRYPFHAPQPPHKENHDATKA